MQCTYERTIQTLSPYHCCRGKETRISYSECVFVALLIQHAMCMRHIVVSSVACLLHHTLPHSHKRQDFWKKYST